MSEPSPDAIDLGDAHWYTAVRDDSGAIVGIQEWHRNGRSEWCGGWVPTRGPHQWTVESENPLTLTPSLLCTACNDHGWIRAGRWEPA